MTPGPTPPALGADARPPLRADARPPLRADARRNREALIRVAADVFALHGADVSLQEVAEAAGVGIGTLYRHFPQREALIAAVYNRNVEALCAEAGALLDTRPPDVAIEEWMERFVEHVRVHSPMTVLLKEASKDWRPPSHPDDPGVPPPLFAEAHALLSDTIGALLAAAADAGAVRADVEPTDLLRALGGLCQVHATRAQARRLIGLLVDGLRFGATARAR